MHAPAPRLFLNQTGEANRAWDIAPALNAVGCSKAGELTFHAHFGCTASVAVGTDKPSLRLGRPMEVVHRERSLLLLTLRERSATWKRNVGCACCEPVQPEKVRSASGGGGGITRSRLRMAPMNIL